MKYVCQSLAWWRSGVLVAELKLAPYSLEMAASLLLGTTGRHPDFLTVPIPMDAVELTFNPPEVVFGRFMQRLMPLLTQLGMELEQTDQICTALTSLALSVRSSSSMPEYSGSIMHKTIV